MSHVAQNATDAALLRSVAASDEAALAELYDRHAGWLLVRLRRRCASADAVDLALQDTFLTLWRNAASYRGQGDVAAFLWGIAIRRLIDAMRIESKALRSRALVFRSVAGDSLVQSAEDEVLLGIEHGRLGEALTKLRRVARGHAGDGAGRVDLCGGRRLLGVPAGTVKSRCHRARMQLRRHWRDW